MTKFLPTRISVIGLTTSNYSMVTINIVIWCERIQPDHDRSIVYLWLSTGLRWEEAFRLDLDQVEPYTPEALRTARKIKLTCVKGKVKTERTVFLSEDARNALADYLEREWGYDDTSGQTTLFLTASSIAVRATDGRLSLGVFNLILEHIGRRHDLEQRDPARHISPLRHHPQETIQ